MSSDMATSARSEPPEARRVWLARAALLAIFAAVVVIIAAEGPVGLTLVLVGLIAAVVLVVGAYWFIARRGSLRWLGVAFMLFAIAFVIVAYVRHGVLVIGLIAMGLLVVAAVAARTALRHSTAGWMPTVPAGPIRHPFIVMNPHSGGGKVVRFNLKDKAEALGAEVFVMEGPGHVDVAALVRDAVARGADLLGVAGGDGTQALVAGIAAEHDIPLMVISAGTRNHFALDLGLDREDPSTCLGALTDGEEVRVDLGMIGDRPFVNNASFGAYAEIVQSPEYRENKNRTMLDMLPDLLSGDRDPNLTVTTHRSTVTGANAVLVSNNPYGAGRLLDMGRRARLDRGELGVVTGQLATTAQAVSLLRPGAARPIAVLSGGATVLVDSHRSTIPVGIDGEALMVDTPVRCTIRPLALRVRLPVERPGVPQLAGRTDWKALFQLALGRAPEAQGPR